MTKYTPFDNKHFVRKAQIDVHQICEHLFKKLDLNYFHYVRFYKDGSLCVLHNRMDWSDYFYQNNFQTVVPLPKQEVQFGKYNLCLWRGVVQDHVVSDARNHCNFDHPLGISIAQKDYFESFAFGTHQGNDGIINTYFNQLETLINFTNQFRIQANSLIKKTLNSKIILPDSFQADQLQLLNKITQVITIQNNNIKIDITSKENEVLRMLCRGLTVKEVSNLMNRSIRTIETHVNHLKNKLGVKRKSQLIGLMLDNGLDTLYDETRS